MSHLLESRLTPEQREECARNDAAMVASMFPLAKGKAKRLYVVTIGRDLKAPRLTFADTACSSCEAIEQNLIQAEEGEKVSARPMDEKSAAVVPFPVLATRQALAAAEVREAIPEAERIAADIAEDVAKGARRHALADRVALDLQLNGSGVR